MHTLSRTLVTDRGDTGRRLDLVVRRHLTDLTRATRTRVQSWIEDGRVSVNGRIVTRPSSRASHGDEIIVSIPGDAVPAPVIAEDGALDVLYEDDDLVVVNKPAGVVSHPTFLHPGGSILNRLLWRARQWRDDQRPSLVGRLDKLTAGIIVAAKSSRAHAGLQRALASATAEKSYLAIVFGPVNRDCATITLRLRRQIHDRRRVVASLDDGLACSTHFRRLEQVDLSGCSVALVECQLATGRMHQIRVHMQASGWPVIGDPIYGEARWERSRDPDVRAALRRFPRQALHAWRVSFRQPRTGARISVEAPIPADMLELMGICGFAVPASRGTFPQLPAR